MTEAKRSRSPSAEQAAPKRPRGDREEVALFLFRRDLRVEDNTGLQALMEEAAQRSLTILPAFFFNPVQCDKDKNPYFGDHFFQFFCQSLEDLDGEKQLNKHLVCLRGSDTECFAQIQKCGYDVTVVGYNEDFTPFAQARDQLLASYASERGMTCVVGKHDYTLRPLDEVVNGFDKPYSVFTPFYNKFLAEHACKVDKAATMNMKRLQSMLVGEPKRHFEKYLVDPSQLYTVNKEVAEQGGRTEGLKRLADVKALKKYEDVRNDIAHDQTSHLSPYMKCGTVSMREVWQASVDHLGARHPFTRQVLWREFYAMLLFHHPRLAQGQLNAFPDQREVVETKRPKQNAPFQAKYDTFQWKWDPAHFEAFREGRTGVPIVDAAVRCLNATGWCHNRNRLIISNFAVKVLAVDWRECERWYATVAVDYDVSNNNGGWLWSSGQGADPQPFFRTFNPFTQAAKFDPDCAFIYKWVPELKVVPAEVVHAWEDYCTKLDQQKGKGDKDGKQGAKKSKKVKEYDTNYPAPIVNIKACKKAVIEQFSAHSKKHE